MVTNNKPRGDGVISGIFGGHHAATSLLVLNDAATQEELYAWGRLH